MFTSLNSPLTLLGTHTKYKGALLSVKKITASDVAWREVLSPGSRISKTNKNSLVLYILIGNKVSKFEKREGKKNEILTKLIANN